MGTPTSSAAIWGTALALCSLLAPPLRCETAVSGIVGDVEWTEEDGPYHATGSVRVPAGQTLTIRPGVIVELDPGVSLVVRGTLLALGTSEKTIVFRPRIPGTEWGGVAFSDSAARGTLEHVEIAHADKANDGAELAGAFSLVRGAKVRLSGCWFHDFEGVVIDSSGASELEMSDSLVERSAEAIHSANSYALLERVHIRDVTGYSDCIDFDNDSTPTSVVRDCILENNATDDGIDTYRTNCLIENVTIKGIRGGKALSLEGPSTPIIRGILIIDSQQGIVSKDGCTPDVRRCTVARCGTAVDCYEKNAGRGGGGGAGESLILWGNTTSVKLDGLSSFSIAHSIVQGGYPGEGNLDADPLFVDEAVDDFHLQVGSPALGAGRDGEDMGAFPVEGPPRVSFIRGNANGDEQIDISDPVTILLVLFGGLPDPACLDPLDADDNGTVEITDAVYLLRYLFLGETAPPPPYPTAGTDPSEDDQYLCIAGS